MILVIGTGSIGERHLRCFAETGRTGVIGCEPNPAIAEGVRERCGVQVASSLDEALARGGWTGAVVCTPAHTHIPIARRCVEAGLPVLIEKPVSTSLDGVHELLQETGRAGVAVRVAYIHRCLPVAMEAKRILASGFPGKILHATVVTGHDFATLRPGFEKTYFRSRATGGGCLQDALTHQIHLLEWLAGPVRKVFCDAENRFLSTREVEDTVNITARLEGGIPASLTCNQFQPPTECAISLHGGEGSLRLDYHESRVGIIRRDGSGWAWTAIPAEHRDAGFMRQAHAFLDAIEGKPDHLATLEEGVQSLQVNLCAWESHLSRREVEVPCATKDFHETTTRPRQGETG